MFIEEKLIEFQLISQPSAEVSLQYPERMPDKEAIPDPV